MVWWAVAGAVVSAYGQIQAGKAAKAEARAKQAQLEEQKKDAVVTSMQEHNIRMSNLKSAMNINESLAGVMGRDSGSDRSLKAIKEKGQAEFQTEDSRARLQFLREQSQRSMGIQIAGMQGRNAMRAAKIGAVSSLLSAGNQYSKISSGSPTADYSYKYKGMD
tara:strand:+ start:13246 stop:13734 length:489 start_codon:yes stop_codon:yes gene_type:complete